jgi:hypothetical protein
MVNRIEAVVDALAFTHKAYQGDSLAYILRNPALLKSFSRPGKNEVNDDRYRVFETYLGGYSSACWEIKLKVDGKSNSGLKTDDKLRNLLGVMGVNQEKDILTVVSFLKKALGDPSISISTPLSYFAV